MKLIICIVCLIKITYSSSKSMPVHKLLDGNEMPALGFGTYLIPPEQVDVAVTSALECGYRHIDTAYVYENEEEIGKTLKKWFAKGNKREDIFITTKLPELAMRPNDVKQVLEISLNKLGLDYVDMYLIRNPFGFERTTDFQELQNEDGTYVIDFSTNHFAIWRELEKQVEAGKIKSIGLSNFNKTQLLRIWNFAKIKPSNLQVETNVYIQQDELLELCQKMGIVLTGYSPLGSGAITHCRSKCKSVDLPPVIKQPIVTKIAEAHNKTAAQILLRFGLQRNIVVITKSKTPARIKENTDIFDFVLSENEMNELRTLDQHGKYRKFDSLSFTGIEHHPEYPFSDRIPKEEVKVNHL